MNAQHSDDEHGKYHLKIYNQYVWVGTFLHVISNLELQWGSAVSVLDFYKKDAKAMAKTIILIIPVSFKPPL